MSVDPIIQSPGNSQSINPYSYIMNNPLSGTDPSGYVAERELESVKIDTIDTEKVSVTGSRIKRTVTKSASGSASYSDGTSQAFTASYKNGNLQSISYGAQSKTAQQTPVGGNGGDKDVGSSPTPKTEINTFNANEDENYFLDSNRGNLDSALAELNEKREGLVFQGKDGLAKAARWLHDNVGGIQDKYGAEVGALIYEIYGDGYYGVGIAEIVTKYHSNETPISKSKLTNLREKESPGQLLGRWHTHPNGSYKPSWGGATGRDSGKMPVGMLHYVSSMNSDGVKSMTRYNSSEAWKGGPITRKSFDRAIVCVVGECR